MMLHHEKCELRAALLARLLVCVLVLLVLTGCGDDMYNQPRYEPLEASDFFEDHKVARHPPAHTIAWGYVEEDGGMLTGRGAEGLLKDVPLEIDARLLARGRERFNIFCSQCHGSVGDGGGMIARRGFVQPPTFHQKRLREVPAGHFFDVVTNGFGKMPSYAHQIPPADRWAIIAYIRVLQLSQNAPLEAAPPQERIELMEQQP